MRIDNYEEFLASQNDITTIEEDGYTVNVKKHLSLAEMIAIVEGVTEQCFEEETGVYRPEMVDFLLRNTVFTFYTDVELPKDIEQKYDFIYRFGGIYKRIMDIIDLDQFYAIVDAIKAKIKYNATANIEAIKKNTQKFMEIMDKFSDDINDVMEGVDKEAMKNLINVLSGNMFDKARQSMKEKTAPVVAEATE